MEAAREAIESEVHIKPIRYDLYISDEDGELTKVVSDLSPPNAARYAVRWARMDQESGCFMWPTGLPLPACFAASAPDPEADRGDRTDILIPDVESGVYVRVAVKLDPKEASQFSFEYAKHNRDRGCTLWPHGSPFPKAWEVIDPVDDSKAEEADCDRTEQSQAIPASNVQTWSILAV